MINIKSLGAGIVTIVVLGWLSLLIQVYFSENIVDKNILDLNDPALFTVNFKDFIFLILFASLKYIPTGSVVAYFDKEGNKANLTIFCLLIIGITTATSITDIINLNWTYRLFFIVESILFSIFTLLGWFLVGRNRMSSGGALPNSQE